MIRSLVTGTFAVACWLSTTVAFADISVKDVNTGHTLAVFPNSHMSRETQVVKVAGQRIDVTDRKDVVVHVATPRGATVKIKEYGHGVIQNDNSLIGGGWRGLVGRVNNQVTYKHIRTTKLPIQRMSPATPARPTK